MGYCISLVLLVAVLLGCFVERGEGQTYGNGIKHLKVYVQDLRRREFVVFFVFVFVFCFLFFFFFLCFFFFFSFLFLFLFLFLLFLFSFFSFFSLSFLSFLPSLSFLSLQNSPFLFFPSEHISVSPKILVLILIQMFIDPSTKLILLLGKKKGKGKKNKKKNKNKKNKKNRRNIEKIRRILIFFFFFFFLDLLVKK